MRQIAMSDKGEWETASSSVPESARIRGNPASQGCKSGICAKVECASLLPGGQTQGAGSLSRGSGNTSSPEPVTGYGAMKGIIEYRFVPRIGIPINQLLPV
jgi:hypothetical protein